MNERDKHGMNEDGNAIALHEDFSRRLNGDVSISYSDDYGYSRDNKMSGNDATIISTHSGSDGIRTRDLHLDRVAC
jgi:hypothetical protein